MDLDAYIDSAAALLGLTIPDDTRDAVRSNLETAERMAKLVDSFPLDPHAEPAPVFSA